ncbi:MAG: hypothetical protein Q8906_09040 [Bacillota bacterium]|nr:hypothetical protein [Bacillota bacterium]
MVFLRIFITFPFSSFNQSTSGTGIGVLGDTKSIKTLLSSGNYYLQDNTRGLGRSSLI